MLRFINIRLLVGLFLICITACKQQTADNGGQFSFTSVQGTTQILAQLRSSSDEATKTAEHGTQGDYIFGELGYGVAYQITQDEQTRVVHNGREGKLYKEIKYLALSRDGQRVAYAASTGDNWRIVVDGVEGPFFKDVGTPLFSPDGRHLLYDAEFNGRWQIVIDNKIDTVSRASFFDKLFSRDGSQILTIENSDVDIRLDEIVIRNLALNVLQRLKISGGGVVYNLDKSRFAVVRESGGKFRAVVYSLTAPALVSEGPLYDAVDRISFGANNELAYIATRGGGTYLVLNDRETIITDGPPTIFPPVVRPGHQSAGVVVNSGKTNQVQFFFDRELPKQKKYEEAVFITFDKFGKSYAYCARNGRAMFFVVNGKESPVYDKVLAPEFSPDGTKVVARVRKDGKRFIVVMGLDAKVIKEHPAYDVVTGPTFTADGKSVAYGVKDGDKLIWKVEKL